LVADAVVTVDAAMTVHRPGMVDVAGDLLTYVGGQAGCPAPPGPVHVVGGLLMPGMVNTHAHTPMTLMRGAGDGLPLDTWLERAVWPREARLTPDDVHWGMLLGAAEMLCAGVTTTCEHYLFPDTVLAALVESGLRGVMTPGIFDLPGTGLDWRTCLRHAVEAFYGWHGRGQRITVGLGPHALYTVPEEGLRAVAATARELGALVQIHLAETRAECAEVRRRFDRSPVEVLADTGLLDGPLLGAHGVWLEESEMARLGDAGASIAHCPGSNGKLGSGIARVDRLVAHGVTVGLGTDGPASNDNLDLWEELRLAPVLARARAEDPAALSTADALRLATRGGAEALGLPVGTLEAGRPADVVRLSLRDGRFTPALDETELVAHLVWSADRSLVTDVWVAGRPVVVGGACTTVDAEEARRQVSIRARGLRDGART
jgi:5-methylthioadenosine/S-adenosylhomocysteine deaminase